MPRPVALGDQRFGPGTLVGELAMLIEIEHETTVIAARGVEALKFSRETLRELMQLDTSLAEALLSRMTARLGALGKRLRAFDETLEQTTRLSAMASMGMHPAPPVPTTDQVPACIRGLARPLLSQSIVAITGT